MTCWYGRRTSFKPFRSNQCMGQHRGCLTCRTAITLWLLQMGVYGSQCGPLTLPRRYELFCREHAQISCQPETTCVKKVQLDSLCAVCHQQSETMSHILWECPFACNGRSLVRGKIQKSNAHASDFFILMRSMLERLPRREMEYWATIAWAIWNARNLL